MPIPIPPAKSSVPGFITTSVVKNFQRADAKKEIPASTAKKKKTVYESVLYRSDFNGEQSKNIKVAGAFYFNHWSKSKTPASGGLTGSYPTNGKPARCLEVKACADNFSGRVSPKINLPKTFSALKISGQVMRSTNYKGNYPTVFIWVVNKNKKGKPLFHKIKGGNNNKWQSFEFTVPVSKLPADYTLMQVNLVSRKDKNANSVDGSIFFKDIKVYITK